MPTDDRPLYRVSADAQQPDGTWVPIHTGYWFEDDTPYQDRLRLVADSLKACLFETGVLVTRWVAAVIDGETVELAEWRTSDGRPARIQMQCRPAQPGHREEEK